jgi:hypothetical protein
MLALTRPLFGVVRGLTVHFPTGRCHPSLISALKRVFRRRPSFTLFSCSARPSPHAYAGRGIEWGAHQRSFSNLKGHI